MGCVESTASLSVDQIPGLQLNSKDELSNADLNSKQLDKIQSVGMATIQIIGFRGVRTINGTKVKQCPTKVQDIVEAAVADHPLLWTGHIGISADKGKTIYGFQPLIPDDMSVETMTETLLRHERFPGVVSNDTVEFQLADLYHHTHGWNTEVVRQLFFYKPARVEKIRTRLEELSKMHKGEHGFKYAFPYKTIDEARKARQEQGLPVDLSNSHNPYSRYFIDEKTSNCATFPLIFFNIEVDTLSGNLRTYLPALKKHSNLEKHGWELLTAFVAGERHHNFKMGRVAKDAISRTKRTSNLRERLHRKSMKHVHVLAKHNMQHLVQMRRRHLKNDKMLSRIMYEDAMHHAELPGTAKPDTVVEEVDEIVVTVGSGGDMAQVSESGDEQSCEQSGEQSVEPSEQSVEHNEQQPTEQQPTEQQPTEQQPTEQQPTELPREQTPVPTERTPAPLDQCTVQNSDETDTGELTVS